MDPMHLDDETQAPAERARSTSPLDFGPSSSGAPGPSSDFEQPPSRQLANVRLSHNARTSSPPARWERVFGLRFGRADA